ncbi:Hypothetical predicted protein [Scomber scombrus]|uniref:Uncharacterized protein n=1 Tax=Scomber scombrus TaxID=13677 RepID=A0AAV1PNK6_SCOSC
MLYDSVFHSENTLRKQHVCNCVYLDTVSAPCSSLQQQQQQQQQKRPASSLLSPPTSNIHPARARSCSRGGATLTGQAAPAQPRLERN